MRRFLLIVSVCVATASVTLRGKNNTANSEELRLAQEMVNAETQVTPAPTPAPVTCNDLTSIIVAGRDWTDVVKTVCTNWPSAFGPFPASSVVGLQDMLEVVMEENGIWSQLLASFNEANVDYCLRIDAQRTVIPATRTLRDGSATFCAPTLNEEVLAAYPEITIGSEGNDDESPLLTGYWANLAALSDAETCVYSQRRAKVISETFSISSMPSGCKMVHAGVCYGDCPAGYRPTFLTGWFRPVCTSVCGSTNHPVTCGVGCANSRTACASVILNQVKEVTIAAAKVAAFFTTGGTGAVIVAAVEQAIKLAEFSFNVLSKVLQIAQVAFEQFSREAAELATLVGIYEMVKETIGDIQGDIVEFLGVVETSVPLFLQLIDAQFGWINIDLGWIAGTLMQNGAGILQGAFEIAKSFAFGKCEIADDTVAFAIEDVGEGNAQQSILGPWTQDGNRNGRPRYRSLLDRQKTVVEWDNRRKTWGVFYKDTSFGSGWWWGWAGFGWRSLYESSANTASFPTSGWRAKEGSLPLPYFVSATNGGV